jgi:hypothetical protein
MADLIIKPAAGAGNKLVLQKQDGSTWIDTDSIIGAPEGTAVLSTGETGGTKFLREDGDNSSSWQTVGDHTPEGTAILSTGETGGTKFLREDGDNSSSWQTVDMGALGSGSTITLNGGIVEKIGTGSISGTTASADLATGNFFVWDLQNASGTVGTYSFTNVHATANYLSNFIVKVIQGSTDRDFNFLGSGPDWWWAGQTPPTMTTGNDAIDVYSFTSWDNGTSWYGAIVGQDMQKT